MGIKVSVNTSPGNRVSINNQNRDTIRSVSVGLSQPVAPTRMQDLTDVTAVNPVDNDTLVYESASGKYVVKTLPTINGGTF
jgi:hypothetical protein